MSSVSYDSLSSAAAIIPQAEVKTGTVFKQDVSMSRILATGWGGEGRVYIIWRAIRPEGGSEIYNFSILKGCKNRL